MMKRRQAPPNTYVTSQIYSISFQQWYQPEDLKMKTLVEGHEPCMGK